MKIGRVEIRWGEPEVREGYTDLVEHAALLNASSSDGKGDAANTSAGQAAASLWGRALSSAKVEGANGILLSPAWLYSVGVDLIQRGQSLSVIEVNGRVQMRRSSSWDVPTGSSDPASWRFKADLPGPGGNGHEELRHGVGDPYGLATSSREPWRGVSPLGSTSAQALAALEKSIQLESGTTTAHLLPVPINPTSTEDEMSSLKSGIAKLRGKVGFVESVVGGWEEGRSGAPASDWKPARLGPMFNPTLEGLRRELSDAVVQGCGIPPALFRADADGTASRAGLQRFIDLSLQPLGDLLAYELSTKLGRTMSLSFDHLRLPDTMLTLSRSIKVLTDAGVALPDALEKVLGDA